MLNELVPDYFLMALPDLLAFFYKKAPEPYQHLYFVNLDMEKTFNIFEISREYGAVTFQEVITKFGKSGQHDFTYYKNFTSILSELSLIMAELDNFSTMHKFTSEFIDLFEDFLVKVSLKENLMPTVFNLFKRTYKEAIWNPSSLIISLNTVVGTRYQEIKKEQEKRFVEEIPIIRYRLNYLKRTLADTNIELSLEERTQFFNALYGNDREVLGAIADVWETYKE